jgi:hypothetical protein
MHRSELQEMHVKQCRLEGSVYDADQQLKTLQKQLDEQRRLRIEQEVKCAELERQLQQAHTRARLTDSVSLYQSSHKLELQHIAMQVRVCACVCVCFTLS